MDAIKFIQKRKYKTIYPFPVQTIDGTGEPIIGYYSGLSVEIFNESDIRRLYENGCYGKAFLTKAEPEFMQKRNKRRHETEEAQTPTTTNTIKKKPLILSMEETFFLCHIVKCLKVVDMLSGEPISAEDLWRKFTTFNKRFIISYVTYLYFKSLNWVVKTGLKYGGNFALYKKGMQYYHASFIVFIQNENEDDQISWLEFQTHERVSEAAGKDPIIVTVHIPETIDINNSEMCLEKLNEFSMSISSPRRYLATEVKPDDEGR